MRRKSKGKEKVEVLAKRERRRGAERVGGGRGIGGGRLAGETS